jgi:myo-inositol-1(or 4)-monophosphatase
MEIALETAHACGDFLREQYKRPKESYEEKSPGDLVSEVDRESQRMASALLLDRTPEAVMLAEEDIGQGSGEPAPGARLTWIVDPLDGTANFLHRFPMFAISIAAAEGRELLAAAVLNPATGECFAAALGEGATLNGAPIRVSEEKTLDRSLLATGWPFRRKHLLPPYMEVFKGILARAQGMRRAGSASLDLSYAAAGRLEGFWEYGLGLWDVAAGALIVREAGGMISDFDGTQGWWESGDIVASNGLIHEELIEVAGTPGGIADLEERATPASR